MTARPRVYTGRPDIFLADGATPPPAPVDRPLSQQGGIAISGMPAGGGCRRHSHHHTTLYNLCWEPLVKYAGRHASDCNGYG